VLKRLATAELETILTEALQERKRGLGDRNLTLGPDLLRLIAEAADGDARRALNLLEIAADLSEGDSIPRAVVEEVVSGSVRRFDKGGDLFYDQISALHKSVRGTAPDAALYWFCRMLDGGCDPLYIARRVVRMASEDIGNADPRALRLALDAWETQERLGSPEGELAIAQAVLYMACAAKSNATYSAFKAAMQDARESGTQEVPMHLRNAPTRLMKELGHGEGYRYAHDEEQGYAAGETYFPEEMGERCYYRPVDRGLEIKIAEKLEQLRRRDRESGKDASGSGDP
jgi:putative ATPase